MGDLDRIVKTCPECSYMGFWVYEEQRGEERTYRFACRKCGAALELKEWKGLERMSP